VPEKLPVERLQEFAKAHDLRQVIVFAWDGILSHIVTWGDTAEVSDAAAEAANRIKKVMGWPSATIVESTKVDALRAELNTALLNNKTQSETIRIQTNRITDLTDELRKSVENRSTEPIPRVFCVEATEMDFGQRSEGYYAFLGENDAKFWMSEQRRKFPGNPSSYMRYDGVGMKPCSFDRRAAMVAMPEGQQFCHVDHLDDLLKPLKRT
jgi:hypothetical protein